MEVGIHDGLKKGIKSFPKFWKKSTCCDKFSLMWQLLVLFPYMIESVIVILLLAPLMIFGFVYRSIKHHAPVMWLILVILLNLASLADLSTDITMLVKYIIPYYFNSTTSGTENQPENEQLSTEENLFYWRLILTLATSLPGVISMFLSDRIKAIDTGKKKTTFKGGMYGLLFLMVKNKMKYVN
jgi:hypothetical protein